MQINGQEPQEYAATLAYYKEKLNHLADERIAWLAKFQELTIQLKDKHDVMRKLKHLKDAQQDQHRAQLLSQASKIQQTLNSIRVDREIAMCEFKTAEEALKIRDLIAENPTVLQRQIPCRDVHISQRLIQNDLNIHSQPNKSLGSTFLKATGKDRQKGERTTDDNKQLSSTANVLAMSRKCSPEDLLKEQIALLRKSQAEEIQTLKHLKNTLESQIKKVKVYETDTLSKERSVVYQLQKQYASLEKQHKLLAQCYFDDRRRLKANNQAMKKDHSQLILIKKNFQDKHVAEEERHQKEFKAQQILISRRSEEFEENYKSQMRAKERNLQLLKDNYQKMQEMYIGKIAHLQQSADSSQHRLAMLTKDREETLGKLKLELNRLERQAQHLKDQKEQLDVKSRQRIEQERQRDQQRKDRQQRQQMEREKQDRLELVYKYQQQGPHQQGLKLRRTKNSRSKSRKRTRQSPLKPSNQQGTVAERHRVDPLSTIRPNQKPPILHVQAGKEENSDYQEEDESIDMSELDSLQQKIEELQKKVIP